MSASDTVDVVALVVEAERVFELARIARDNLILFDGRPEDHVIDGATRADWEEAATEAKQARKEATASAAAHVALARDLMPADEWNALKDRMKLINPDGEDFTEMVASADETALHAALIDDDDFMSLIRRNEPQVDESARVVTIWQNPRVARGGSFVYDVPETPPAIWGGNDEILWAKGESFMVAGPTGVGKSTLMNQIAAGRLGLIDSVLGFPVVPATLPILYLAMDRPAQIQRLQNRFFRQFDARDVLEERLVIWRGPLPADLNTDPEVLVRLAIDLGVGEIYMDSLKDGAVKLTDDESGGKINRALQLCLAENIDVAVLHHQRKSPADATKAPKSLDDIYGSALIPAGMGSVVVLHGAAGDPIVDFLHLKQPMETVGPLRIEHDNQTGMSSVVRGFDPLAFLQKARDGVTVMDVAKGMFEKQAPTSNEQAKARRQLDRLVRTMPDRVHRIDPAAGGAGGQQPARWYYVEAAIELTGAATGAATQGVAA